MSEMKKTIKLKNPKIVITNNTRLNVPNLLFEEDYMEVVLRYCEQSPHRYEIPQQCMSCEKRFKHSHVYLLHIKTNNLCAQEDMATTNDQEEVACTENPPSYNKDVEVVPLNVTLEQINLLYKCKQFYTIFRTINTLNLHRCECYA